MRKYFRKIVSKKALKILAGLAAGTILVTGITLLPSGKIKLCAAEKCYTLTQNEYQNLKLNLIEKSEKGEAMAYEEYQLLVQIYDFEMKHKDLKLTDVKLDQVLKRINDAIIK